MTSYLTVDTASPVPPYEQIRVQLAELIQHGVLTPGSRLPPVRQLASDLGLATGTVARAYRELEGAALVVSRRGGGTRVAVPPAPSTPGERDELLAAQAEAYVVAARRLGADDHSLVAAVHRASRAFAGGGVFPTGRGQGNGNDEREQAFVNIRAAAKHDGVAE
jgi:GntR family transcriptional regulator